MDRKTVYDLTLKYFKGDSLAADVWVNKYCLKNVENGEIVYHENTPNDMHDRIANELYRIELKYPNPLLKNEIFDLIQNFKYIIPQGSPMSGIGNNFQIVSLSNCFVIGNQYDSYGSIIMTDEEQIQLMKRRGGVGHDLSHIRPKGTIVQNSALTSTGIVPFMERFSNSTKEVAQDGRRGALMLTISINHPDSEDFIDAKLEQGKVTGSNISIKLDDEFMNCVLNGTPYIQKFPIYSDNPKVTKSIDAKKLWDKIIHNAWKSAEPGVLFWDTVIRESVPDCYLSDGFKTVSTNPCLTGDSLIQTSKGEITIKEIVDNFTYDYDGMIGEPYEILTYNEKTSNLEYNYISDALLSKRNANIIEIEMDDGTTLKLTPEHKVFTKNRKWVEASKLTENDILIKIE